MFISTLSNCWHTKHLFNLPLDLSNPDCNTRLINSRYSSLCTSVNIHYTSHDAVIQKKWTKSSHEYLMKLYTVTQCSIVASFFTIIDLHRGIGRSSKVRGQNGFCGKKCDQMYTHTIHVVNFLAQSHIVYVCYKV